MATPTRPDDSRRIVTRDDHRCFGCGRQNPRGLHLSFYELQDANGLWAPFTPKPDHEGFAGIVHGGIVTAVLDEVMGWAVFHRGIWAVTGKLSVTFRHPVEIAVPTRALGRLQADRGRLLDVVAELRRDADDLLLAAATATFFRVPETQARAWEDRYLVQNDGQP